MTKMILLPILVVLLTTVVSARTIYVENLILSTNTSNASTGNVTGSGVANYLPVWTSSTALGDSGLLSSEVCTVSNGFCNQSFTALNNITDVPKGVQIRGNVNFTTTNFAIGNNAQATAAHGFSVGEYASSTAQYAVAMGYKSNASNTLSVNIGANTIASYGAAGIFSIAIGTNARVDDNYGVCIGNACATSGEQSVAVGDNSDAGYLSVAIGKDAEATGMEAIAIGSAAIATHNDSIALGTTVETTANNQAKIGDSGQAYSVDIDGSLTSRSGSISSIPITAKGAVGQSSDLQQWQDSSGNALANINSVGRFRYGSPTDTSALLSVSSNYNNFVSGLSIEHTAGSKETWRLGVTNPTGGSPFGTGTFAISNQGSNNAALVIDDDYNEVGIGQNNIDRNAQLSIKNVNSAYTALEIIGHASQTADLTQWMNSSGTVKAKVDKSGNLNTTGYVYFGNARILESGGIVYIQTAAGGSPRIYGPSGIFLGSFGIGYYDSTKMDMAATSQIVWNSGTMSSTRDSGFKRYGTNTLQVTDGASGYGGLVVGGATVGSVPMTVKGYVGQVANLQEWQNSSGSVLGSINGSGTAFLKGVYASGYIHNETGRTMSIGSTGVYYNVTNWTISHAEGFSGDAAAGKVTALYDGDYKFDVSFSFSGGGGDTYHVVLAVNGAEDDSCHGTRKLGTAGDVGNMGITCLITLSQGDYLHLWVEDKTAGASDIQIYDFNANIVRIGG